MTVDTLLIAAHGTRSETGQATIMRIVDAVSEHRRDIPVAVGYLDVLEPTFADALAALDGPVVVVPALLSVGVHVINDIPAAVGDRAGVHIARHLGPSPMLVDVLIDRLQEAGSTRPVTLVATGSSDAGAARELLETAEDLESVLGRPVFSTSLGGEVAIEPGTDLAVYLLAEGLFYDKAVELGEGAVTRPLGAHPALVELVWRRYDEALGRDPAG
jgi:sirohydrochlorin ferrochelatase